MKPLISKNKIEGNWRQVQHTPTFGEIHDKWGSYTYDLVEIWGQYNKKNGLVKYLLQTEENGGSCIIFDNLNKNEKAHHFDDGSDLPWSLPFQHTSYDSFTRIFQGTVFFPTGKSLLKSTARNYEI